jgi:S1-C subfamily serine protease
LNRSKCAAYNFPVTVARALLLAILSLSATTSLSAQDSPSNQAPEKPGEGARQDLLSQFNDSLQELTARVSPSIVQVQVTGYRATDEKNPDQAGVIGRERSLGSGVIVDPTPTSSKARKASGSCSRPPRRAIRRFAPA